MNIEGTYTLQAPPENVWHCLMDPQVLLKTIPGIERLEKIDEHTFDITLQMKAPFKGSYQGRFMIVNQQYPYHYEIAFSGEGRQDTFKGTGNIYVDTQNNNTIIRYKGTLTSNKRAPLIPPAVLKGALKLTTQQFLAALAAYLRTHPHVTSPDTTVDTPSSEEAIVLTPSTPPAGTLRWLIHLSGLGTGDPGQEARWERRIRRAGYISFLLLLVWIGTRIPRKR